MVVHRNCYLTKVCLGLQVSCVRSMQSLAYKVHAKRKRICFLETLLHVLYCSVAST